MIAPEALVLQAAAGAWPTCPPADLPGPDDHLEAADARQAELRARLLAHGEAALDDSECLELLCGCEAEAASRLLAEFGSLPEAVGAAGADLCRLAGAAAAARLKAAQAVAGRLLLRPLKRRDVLSSWSAVTAFLRTRLVGAPREQFRVLFLDRRNRLIAEEPMWEGTVEHAPVYPREVMRRALELHASALVLAHNHPACDPTPSSADIEMTQRLTAAARTLGITIHDHIIVAGAEIASFKSLGLM